MSKGESPPGPLIPAAYTADDLADDLGLRYSVLAAAAARIPRRGYTQFTSPGAHKKRVISEPAPWLMTLQRALVDRVSSRLPVSKRVFSTKGRDTIQHAREHVGHDYLVAMDIRDCYPSILLGAVRGAFLKAGFSERVAMLLSRLVTHKGRLPQGAPSSAATLDLVLCEADDHFELYAARQGAVYSRFADDLCFSGPAPLAELRRHATRFLLKLGLSVSATKTHTWGPGDTKIVTKIVVADRLYATPTYLRSLDAAIRTYGSSRTPTSARSILGQIGWVMRLNKEQGDDYLNRFNRTRLSRRPQRRLGTRNSRGGAADAREVGSRPRITNARGAPKV